MPFFLALLYESTGRAIAVSRGRRCRRRGSNVIFLVKGFMCFLKMLMDHVDTLLVDRYWSEGLCCTIMTHLGDPEVKVMD